MDRMDFRPILAPVLGLALCFTFSLRPGATTRDAAVAAHYVARAVSATDNMDLGRIDIYIERWSADGDQDRLLAAVRGGGDKLVPAPETLKLRVCGLTVPGAAAS